MVDQENYEGIRADILVRQFRDEMARLASELRKYAKELGVKDMDAVDDIVIDFLLYEVEYEDAKRRIEELARKEREEGS